MLHDVHFLQLPVPLWMRAQEQLEALIREFTLISFGHPDSDDLPQRLLALMASFQIRFAHVIGGPQEVIMHAALTGVPVIEDLVYPTAPEGAEAAASLLRLLAETDDYCQTHREMTVLAADPEAVRFRQWFLRSFVDQSAGLPAVPWPQWT